MAGSDTQITRMTKRLTLWAKALGLFIAFGTIVGGLWTFVAKPQVKEVVNEELEKEHDGLVVHSEPVMRAIAEEEAREVMEENIPRISKIASEEAEDVGVAVWDRTESDLEQIQEEQRRTSDKLDRLIEHLLDTPDDP